MTQASPTLSATYRRLAEAQKGAARSAPAYSRFVNRRIGRLLAVLCHRAGMTPNSVTLLSGTLTYTGIALLALVPPRAGLAAGVVALLVLGYALDSADGQVARLTGVSSPRGEWLDHLVDAGKIVSLPLAVLVGAYRFTEMPTWWLLVPLAHAVFSSVFFFGMILTEQLRRAHGVRSVAASRGRMPWLRSVLVLPTDYGVMCWAFAFVGAYRVFAVLYGVLVVAQVGMTVLALGTWWRDLGRLPVAGSCVVGGMERAGMPGGTVG